MNYRNLKWLGGKFECFCSVRLVLFFQFSCEHSSNTEQKSKRSTYMLNYSIKRFLTFSTVSLCLFCSSVKMVLLWTAGDIFKTTYFIMNESPAQFWVCGSVQILIDVAILLQVLFYSRDTRVKLG